ncbi:phosphatidate cytidylyltransferase [Planctomicrobium sp. SH668]|uniref:phosphatidate cytidylyltransferase n=1 Tax=Planctomicrobium sp. SH668 TaxID=3448126 RepID=UPI003F5B3A00
MLAWRVLISAILIPLLVAVFYFDAKGGESALLLLGFVGLLALRGVWELAELFRARVPDISVPAVSVCVLMIILGGWFPHLQPPPLNHLELTPLALACCFSLMFLLAVESWRFKKSGKTTETLATEMLIVSYVGLLLAMTAQLRWVAGSAAGYLAIGSLIICAKGGDIGAYFVGKRFGRTKMAPILSPKKTWEGAVGSLLGASLCGWLWFYFVPPFFFPDAPAPAWYFSLLYGAVIGIAGMVGDVCESLLKRDMDRKDSAALFPGFGGLLDILDSVLYAGPVALLLWKVLPLATWLQHNAVSN